MPPANRNRLRVVALAAAIATAAQLAPVQWRLMGNTGGYAANEDERFYYALFAAAGRDPITTTNPFDDEWHDAAPSGTRLLSLLVSAPTRLGLPAGATWDAARWLGSGASVLVFTAIGGIVATPAVGAAAAALVLLDPGSFHGKPLFSLLGTGVHPPDDPHQLFSSRALVPSLTLPFFLLAVLGLLRLSLSPLTSPSPLPSPLSPVFCLAAVGLSGHLFTWSGALAAAAAAAVLHSRRRRMLVPAAAGCLLALVLVFLGGLGRHGAPLEDILLRVGSIRTHRPQFLLHTGFWAGAVASAVLAFGPWRIRSAARALGIGTLGAWALALLHTPLLGWDIESFHYAYILGPLTTMTWCVLVWHAWRWLRRRRADAPTAWPYHAVAAAVAIVAFMGPIRSARGLAASIAEGSERREEARSYLRAGNLPGGSVVAVPEALRMQLGMVYDGVVYASHYQHLWSVPDPALFQRAVCASALAGMDSAEVVRDALRPRPGNLAVWYLGRPDDVSTAGIRSYFDLFDTLAARLGGAVSETGRSVVALERACTARPDFALAIGAIHVRRAQAAVVSLGGSERWLAGDGSAAWFDLRIGGQ